MILTFYITCNHLTYDSQNVLISAALSDSSNNIKSLVFKFIYECMRKNLQDSYWYKAKDRQTDRQNLIVKKNNTQMKHNRKLIYRCPDLCFQTVLADFDKYVK